MTIIGSVKDFIMQCPYLDELKRINVDFLTNETNAYSIEEQPAEIVTRQFIDGSSERQFVFVFATTFLYNEELQNNIENCGFFEKFADWLEHCTLTQQLPKMPNKCTAWKIEATGNGYLFGVDEDMKYARYQIPCKLMYDKEI